MKSFGIFVLLVLVLACTGVRTEVLVPRTPPIPRLREEVWVCHFGNDSIWVKAVDLKWVKDSSEERRCEIAPLGE